MSRPGGGRAWSLALLLLSVNAGCGGYRPVPEFEPAELKSPVPVAGTPFTLLWRSRPVRGPSAPVAVDATSLYIGGSDRRVVAVDLQSGRTRWSVRASGSVVGGVLQAGDLIFAGTEQPGGKVHAFRSISGSEVWASSTGYIQSPLALVDGKLIGMTRKNQVVALNAATGRIAWRLPLPTSRHAPVPLGGGDVLISSYDSLYRIRVMDGKVTLRRRAPGVITAGWRAFGNLLVAGTGDSLVLAIDPDSLTEQWRVQLDAPVLTPPAVTGDTLFAVTQVGSLYRIVTLGDGAVAEPLQRTPWPATGAPEVIGAWILTGASNGGLRAYSRHDGSLAWTTQLGRPVELGAVALPDSGFLIFGGRGDLQRMHP